MEDFIAAVKVAHHLNIHITVPFVATITSGVRTGYLYVQNRDGDNDLDTDGELELPESTDLGDWMMEHCPELKRLRVQIVMKDNIEKQDVHRDIVKAFEVVVPLLTPGFEIAIGFRYEHGDSDTCNVWDEDVLMGLLFSLTAKKGLEVTMRADSEKEWTKGGKLRVLSFKRYESVLERGGGVVGI